MDDDLSSGLEGGCASLRRLNWARSTFPRHACAGAPAQGSVRHSDRAERFRVMRRLRPNTFLQWPPSRHVPSSFCGTSTADFISAPPLFRAACVELSAFGVIVLFAPKFVPSQKPLPLPALSGSLSVPGRHSDPNPRAWTPRSLGTAGGIVPVAVAACRGGSSRTRVGPSSP